MSGTEPSKGFFASFDNWWFGKGSPTSLGLFRIFIGTLTSFNFLFLSLDFKTWFGDRGFVPNWLEHQWMGQVMVPLWRDGPGLAPRLNLLSGITDDRIVVAFYVVTCLAALLTTIGLWTRFSSILLAICVVSLHHRNEMILHGGDTVIRLMCIYLAVAPCGRAVSVDRLLRLWKGVETRAAVQVSLWAQRLIQYNMALLYFTTTWLKRSGSHWMDGTATYYPANLNEFDRFPVPGFVNDLFFVRITTYGTLIAEFLLGTLVFYRPARKYVLIGGILMHGWIEYSMNIPLFSWLMVSMYITFYDGEEVSGWFKRLGGRLKRFAVSIRLPKGTELQPARADFFAGVDPLGLVAYEAGDNEALSGRDVHRSWTRSLGAWPWGALPGLWRRLLENSLTDAAPEAKPSRRR